MKLFGFPRPCDGELFSSWIQRCALSPQCKAVSPEDVEMYFSNCIALAEDVDFCFEQSFEGFCQATGVAPEWCRIFFSQRLGNTALNPWFRKSYCPDCVKNDVATFGFPCWRQEWCSLYFSHCQIHKRLLQSVDFLYFDERGWNAFVLSLGYERECYRADKMKAILVMLVLRVQRFLSGRSLAFNDKNLCAVADFLLMSFLSLRTDWRESGYAKHLFKITSWSRVTHEDYSYEKCMLLGSTQSSAIERAAALLLLGVILKFFKEQELRFLKNYFARRFKEFPVDAESVGLFFPEFEDSSEKTLYIEQLRTKHQKCSALISDSVEDFISSICRHSPRL